MIHLGTVPASTSVYIPFATYGKTNGESITCTGLAVTDVEIYKNGSTTQRSSDAGVALLDTDGIDFDGITGLHGFSIDLSDNTDSGFYAVGSWYWVVVSAITVDSQTVTFLAASFRIGPAEAVAGVQPVDAMYISGDATAADNCELMFDGTGYAGGTARLKVDVDTIKTQTVTCAGGVTFPAATLASTTNITAGTIATVTNAVTLPTIPTNWITADGIAADAIGASELAADAATEIADAFLNRDMSTGTDSGSATVRTPRQALYILRNKWSITTGTLTVCKTDDSTTSWTATLTATAGTDPVTASDPASA